MHTCRESDPVGTEMPPAVAWKGLQKPLLGPAGSAREPGWPLCLCEALPGALVEEQVGSSLGAYLCDLCKITGSGQNSFG